MTMDASAIQAIRDLTRTAVARTFTVPQEPSDVYYLQDVGTTESRRQIAFAGRPHGSGGDKPEPRARTMR